MFGGLWIGRDFRESGRRIIEILFRNLCGDPEENHRTPESG
jgi:hypothetical protein